MIVFLYVETYLRKTKKNSLIFWQSLILHIASLYKYKFVKRSLQIVHWTIHRYVTLKRQRQIDQYLALVMATSGRAAAYCTVYAADCYHCYLRRRRNVVIA